MSIGDATVLPLVCRARGPEGLKLIKIIYSISEQDSMSGFHSYPLAIIDGLRYLRSMQTLEKLLRHYAKRKSARWWIGRRPEGREGEIARLIAAQVAYPTSASDPFANGGLVRLNKDQAAHVLAVAGTTRLVHGKHSPSKGQVKEVLCALGTLRGDAAFLSNGLWDMRAPLGWSPLSAATFDCGIIGYDTDQAFIFWVEEED